MDIQRIAASIVLAIAAASFPASGQTLAKSSDRLAFDVEIDPHPKAKGEYLVTISVTDLETGKAVEGPLKLALKTRGSFTFADFPRPIMAGVDCTSGEAPLEGRCMNIFFAADGDLRRAACEIIVTRNREVVSRHRYGVRLDA